MSSKRFIFHSKTILKLLIYLQCLGQTSASGELNCQNCGLFDRQNFDDDQRHCKAYNENYCASIKETVFGSATILDVFSNCGTRQLLFPPPRYSQPGWLAGLVTKGM